MLPGKSRTLFGVTPSSFRPQPSICFGTVGIDRVTIQISSRDLTRRRLAFPIPTMTLGDHGSPSHSPLALWREHEVGSLQRQEPLQIFMRRSEEHTSELQSLMRISYAVFCLKKT